MLRGAVVNEQAGAQLRDFIQARLEHGTTGADRDDRALRAGLVAAMLVGVVVSRRIIGVPALAAADHQLLALTLGPALQSILTG